MQQQLPDGGLRVRWVREDGLGVGEESLSTSLLLEPDRWTPWAPVSFEEIDEAAIESLLALSPELILLGTGNRQRFLPPRLQARLLAAGVGVECMDNGAAARTFNLLADEGRRVLAAFLIETSG
nr:MTH938/NDUFAF3 family protein [Lysobacter sp. CAU 1642]